MKIAIINGANINFAGIREPHIYGSHTLAEINRQIFDEAKTIAETALAKIDLQFFHSNIEGEIINILQNCHEQKFDGIILNAGAFSHYSYAIRDAVASLSMPVIEVHMSNPYSREEFRHTSVIAPVCRGHICGFRSYGYTLAIHALIKTNLEVYE
ncbi:MAG: type II 3-dehydroquinate dehydratase [Clostridiales bacterium]|jgi:3-dehydroquinate dehydratase-2|nr:type II 3-dehydroquinate dehydratase [Clostridiales bacterium]